MLLERNVTMAPMMFEEQKWQTIANPREQIHHSIYGYQPLICALITRLYDPEEPEYLPITRVL